MEFKILVLEYGKLRLYDLEKNEHDFEKIPDNYDILFLDVKNSENLNYQNPNYKFEFRFFDIRIYRNIKFKIYNFGLITQHYIDSSSRFANLAVDGEIFSFSICQQNKISGIPVGECLDDNLLYQRIDSINDSLPLIVISRLDVIQIKFLCSLFNITEINIINDEVRCYLIEKKEIIKKAAIKKIEN
ncbi:hypothetical protein Hokovirus_1_259 [Hokovirus HKV1]|uniref:Uncharacterized protein n=1 Tax=Hokovirus HKV1 TaxID=1977638 RepID=A0A1V0SF88_9VIRU|nr:hypothetical protein Hokovirus_1_259 [Hokovirus HKV1]